MEKLTIVINGESGSGKDTICDIVGEKYKVMNVSSIDPVKEIAKKCGWNGVKDYKSRIFLTNLKKVLIEYNDYPNAYLLECEDEFLKDPSYEIMFVHIREFQQIEDFMQKSKNKNIVTLFIERKDNPFSSAADKAVDMDGEYMYWYLNDKPLEEFSEDFMKYFEENIIKRKGNICIRINGITFNFEIADSVESEIYASLKEVCGWNKETQKK